MNIVQNTGRAARKNSRASGMPGVLIVALVLAAALLAACGAEISPDGAEAPQEDGSNGSAASPQAIGGNEADIKDSTIPSSAGKKADDEGFIWTDGKLIRPDGKSNMDASFLFAADQGDIFTVNGDFNIIDKNGEPLDESSLKAGALIRVEYDLVLESYPGQIFPRTVQVMDEGEDMIGLYTSMLDAIWKVDVGLNPGNDGMLAIDIEEADNLTAGEKNALVWLAGSRFGIRSVASTFEKLEEEGYIDGMLLQFKEEDGMIIKISTSDVKEDSFMFDISKWVSGLGADWYSDCTASKTDGAWTFELGIPAVA
jgi:hypothetical protein